ncbi:hypothetical protein D3C71_662010 [compost metagenome]
MARLPCAPMVPCSPRPEEEWSGDFFNPVSRSPHEDPVLRFAPLTKAGAPGTGSAHGPYPGLRRRVSQDVGVLLRRKPGKLLSGHEHHRHVLRRDHAGLQHHRRVRARRHQGHAGPGRKMGHLGRRHRVHLPPAQGREVAHHEQELQAHARLQRRRLHLHARAPVEGERPLLQGHEPEPLLLQRHGHAQAAEVGGPHRRPHGEDHAQPGRGAVPGQPGDAVRGHPVEGVRHRDAEGRHAREGRPGPGRHRAVLPRAVPEGRDHPLQGLPAVLGRQGQDRRPRVRDHARCLGALGQAAKGRVPRHAVPEPGRPRCDPQGPERAGAGAAGPERGLPLVQHDEEALRRRARAQGHQHGDQQEGHHRRRVPHDRRGREEPDPAHAVVLQRCREGRPVRPRSRQEAAGAGRLPRRLQHRPVGHAGAAPVQPERQAHRRADAGRPGQDQRQGRDQELRVGRVPQAPAGRRAPDGHAGLDRRQRRPGQLHVHPAGLRLGQVGQRQQHLEVLLPAV